MGKYKKMLTRQKNIFCDTNCKWLSPTEKEQDMTPIKNSHRCAKYRNIRLFHHGAHPLIYKCRECFEAIGVCNED